MYVFLNKTKSAIIKGISQINTYHTDPSNNIKIMHLCKWPQDWIINVCNIVLVVSHAIIFLFFSCPNIYVYAKEKVL